MCIRDSPSSVYACQYGEIQRAYKLTRKDFVQRDRGVNGEVRGMKLGGGKWDLFGKNTLKHVFN